MGEPEGRWKGTLMKFFSRYRGTHPMPPEGPPGPGAWRGTARLRGKVVLGLLVVIAALGVLVPAASADGLPDYSAPGEAWNVLPPGESGSLTPGPHSVDQIPLYDGLTPLFDQVTDAHQCRATARAARVAR